MPNWDDLKCLMHLARGRTMTNAATALRTNVSTISRRLERLNSKVGNPIITKSGNSWELTDYGRQLASAANEFQITLDRLEAENARPGATKTLQRQITLSIDSAISGYLTKQIAAFSAAYPWIELSIITDPDKVNLAEGVVDLAVMLERPQKGRVICRKVIELEHGLFYQGDHEPTKWVGLDRSMENSSEMKLGLDWFGKDPELRINNLHAIKAAVDETGWAGVGFTLMYPPKEGYVQLGGRDHIANRDIWLGFHETRRHDQAVRAVADWIISSFEAAEREARHYKLTALQKISKANVA